MKASIKFRREEEQPPLVRAKLPVRALGVPVNSAVSLGAASDLRFDLTTAFRCFPSLRFSYRPADSRSPFSIVVKSGAGALGSPFGSPMSMTAEFNLLGGGGPRFFFCFRPEIGDFCLRRFVREETVSKGCLMEDFRQSPGRIVDQVLSGTEIIARSVIPVKRRAAVNVRWCVKMPTELHTVESGGNRCGMNLPRLVMSKISVQYFGDHSKQKMEPAKGFDADDEVGGGGAPDWGHLSTQRQLDSLRSENGMLRKAMEDLRSEFASLREWKKREDGNWNGNRELGIGKGKEKNGGNWSAVAPHPARNAAKGDRKGATATKNEANEQLKAAAAASSLKGATGARP